MKPCGASFFYPSGATLQELIYFWTPRQSWSMLEAPVCTQLNSGFPKIRGTFLEVLIIRMIVFWGLFWGPLVLGNYCTSVHGPSNRYLLSS